MRVSKEIPAFDELEDKLGYLRLEGAECAVFTFAESGVWHWWLALPTYIRNDLPRMGIAQFLLKPTIQWTNPSLRDHLIGPDDLTCTPLGISLLGDTYSRLWTDAQVLCVEACEQAGIEWASKVLLFTFNGASWDQDGSERPSEKDGWFDGSGKAQMPHILRSQIRELSNELDELTWLLAHSR